MGFAETMLIYGVIGFVMATALCLMPVGGPQKLVSCKTVLAFCSWVALWPLFAPSLFAGQSPEMGSTSPNPSLHARHLIEDTQKRFMSALVGVEDEFAQDVLRPQVAQINAMMRSLSTADVRLQEMDALLATPEFSPHRVDAAIAECESRSPGDEDPRIRGLKAWKRNIERLETMRWRTREELDRALVKMEEITSQILLLRFVDQPEVKLASLLEDVASSVEDLTQVVLDTSKL